MSKVEFFGGPYDGKSFDMPFIPDVMVFKTMDGENKLENGKFTFDARVSQYIYRLEFPNGENEPFAYRLKLREPKDLYEWFGA